jgi:hypothetical protein
VRNAWVAIWRAVHVVLRVLAFLVPAGMVLAVIVLAGDQAFGHSNWLGAAVAIVAGLLFAGAIRWGLLILAGVPLVLSGDIDPSAGR